MSRKNYYFFKAAAYCMAVVLFVSILLFEQPVEKVRAETRVVNGYTLSIGGYLEKVRTGITIPGTYTTNIVFNLWNPSATVIAGNSSESIVDLSRIDVYWITGIGADAFSGFNNIVKLKLNQYNSNQSGEEGFLTSIGNGAFQNCKELVEVDVTITAYTTYVYSSEYQMHKAVSNKIMTIGNNAFKGCSKLSSVGNLISGALIIGNSAFAGCSSLANVSFSATKEIGSYAFKGCTSLTTISLPTGVSTIGDGVFEDCTGITSVELSSTMKNISAEMFKGCTNLNSIIIPNGVTSIGNEAFKNCTSLTSITIPSSVTSIGDGAFEGCSNLTSVTIPDSVTSIGANAFKGCEKITSISIPKKLTTLGNDAFNGCTGIPAVTIPGSLTKIGNGAFEGCTALSTVTMPLKEYSNLTSIGDKAFRNCTKLTGDLLVNCIKLTSVGAYAFENCAKITSISMPQKLSLIGEGAFKGCSLLENVTMPKEITAISEYTFSGCEKIAKICVPEGVTAIYKYAFENCVALKKLYLPKTLIRIEDSVFGNEGNPVKIETVFYGEGQSYRKKHLSIAGTSNEEFGNGYLNTKSEWVYGQTEASFESGHAIYYPEENDDESGDNGNGEGENGETGNNGGNGGSEGNGGTGNMPTTGYIYSDYEFKTRIEFDEPVKIIANAPRTTQTGEAGSVLDLFTDITPTYTFSIMNGRIKGRLGNVVAGITSSEEKPYVLGGKKINDAVVSNIAVAQIRNGVITIKAKKEPGTVYLHVVDTGDGGAHACIKVEVVAAPKKIKIYQDETPINKLFMKEKETVKVYVKPLYETGDKQEVEITDSMMKVELKGDTAGYFKVEPSETEQNCYIITNVTLKNGKNVRGKIEFICQDNGKKATLTVTAGE